MIKSNSNKNGKELVIKDDNKTTKKEKEDPKNSKQTTLRTKQNSKILNNKEKTLKKVFIPNRFKKEFLGINTNSNLTNPIYTVSTPTAHKKTPIKKDILMKSVPNFGYTLNSKKNFNEEEALKTEELLMTTPNTITHKKFSKYERKVSSGSFKEKIVKPKKTSPTKNRLRKSNSNSKFNSAKSKKQKNKYKYTGKSIKEEESKMRDDNYIITSNYIDTKDEINNNLENGNEEELTVQIITSGNTLTTNPNMKNLNNFGNLRSKTNISFKEEEKIFSKNTFSAKGKQRPVSNYNIKEVKQSKSPLMRTLNNTNGNLNNTFNTNIIVINTTGKIRAKSSYKKPEIELKLNEASLSTEASSAFRGRIEDYAIGKEIGKGAYAIVKQALHKPSNKKMAIKFYEKVKLLDTQRKNSVKREIQILKKLEHINIVKLNEVIDNSKQILLIMELVNGVSLLTYLKAKNNRRIAEIECKQIFFQIVRGIAHCHSRGVCHRDIKLENVIVEESKLVKIIDFGFGAITSENKLCNFFCGTPSYMPPEIVQKRDYVGQYADIWSLGILLYTLLCGAFPFKALNEKDLYSKITKCVYNFPEHMSSSACDLVRRILNLTPANRPSAEEIINDSWFNHHNINYDENAVSNYSITSPSSTIPKISNRAE